MHRLPALLALALLAACAGGAAPTTSVPTTTTTTTAAPTTTAVESTTTVPDCGSIPYEVGSFPERVEPGAVPTDDVERDEYTSVPGTVQQIWVDADGDLALVFVRGALPPIDWPGERGEVSIDGARGVAGPHDDGSWVVAWFEGDGEPCDRFYMVFYPPVEPSEVEATIESLDRRAG